MKYLLTLFMVLFSTPSVAERLYPTTEEAFEIVTVKITNLEENTGGTGVILNSYPSHSIILTNRHICNGILQGGYVHSVFGKHLVKAVRLSTMHDLCLVLVIKNLKYSITVARTSDVNDTISITGHPFLMPRQTIKGKITGYMIIKLMTGMRECTKEEMNNYPLFCLMNGGVPVYSDFEATTTSAIIAPGNSGSPVFNEKGQLTAMVFAGVTNGLSFGFLVPLEYIRTELKNPTKWTKIP